MVTQSTIDNLTGFRAVYEALVSMRDVSLQNSANEIVISVRPVSTRSSVELKTIQLSHVDAKMVLNLAIGLAHEKISSIVAEMAKTINLTK